MHNNAYLPVPSKSWARAGMPTLAQIIKKMKQKIQCGIPSNEFEFMRANSLNKGNQVQSNWCWAACVQMVLNYHGLQVSQIDVVTRIYGSPYVDLPANQQQILHALSGWAPDHRGRYSSIIAKGGVCSFNNIQQSLFQKRPLIVGINGHAYVLTGLFLNIETDMFRNIREVKPKKVVLRDPWPGNSSRQEMKWKEFKGSCLDQLYPTCIEVGIIRH